MIATDLQSSVRDSSLALGMTTGRELSETKVGVPPMENIAEAEDLICPATKRSRLGVWAT